MWQPSESDIQWLKNLVNSLKVNGFWIAPSYGVIFRKIQEDTLAIMPPLIVSPIALAMIERTKEIAEAADIKLRLPDKIILMPLQIEL